MKQIYSLVKSYFTIPFQKTVNPIEYYFELAVRWLFAIEAALVVIYKIAITINDNLVPSPTAKNSIYLISFLLLICIFAIKIYWEIRNRLQTDKKLPTNSSRSDGISILNNPRVFWLAVFAVIAIFTVIRAPYFDNTFAARHPLKYNTYVEPAKYMYENSDLLHMQRKYLHNPVSNSQGMGQVFDNIPLLEWMLYLSLELFYDSLGLEVATHLTMHLIGVGIILATAQLIRKLFSSQVAIFTILLLAFNPVFNIATYITVYDSLNLLLVLIALIYFIHTHKKTNYKSITAAGLITGLAIAVKYNTAIWAFPLVTFIAFFTKKDLKSFLTQMVIFTLASIAPVVISVTSIKYLPSATTSTYITLFVGILITTCYVLFIDKIRTWIEAVVEFVLKHIKTTGPIILLAALIIGITLFGQIPARFTEEFITDSRLILNMDLYFQFVNTRVIPYLSLPISALVLIAIPATLVAVDIKKVEKLAAFFFSSIIYVLIASKVLYFHSYYWLIIIMTFILLVAILTERILRKQSLIAFGVVSALLIGNLYLNINPIIYAKIGKDYPEINELADRITYLNNGVEDYVYLEEGDSTYIIFKTDLYKLHDLNFFHEEEVRELVEELGFVEAMQHYNIRYLVTKDGNLPNYHNYVSSISNEIEQSAWYRRTDQIYADLYPTKFEYLDDLGLRNEIIDDYDVPTYFCYDSTWGRYSLYIIDHAENCENGHFPEGYDGQFKKIIEN